LSPRAIESEVPVAKVDVVLVERVVAGVPMRTILRDGQIMLCLASHAVEIPLEVSDVAALGEVLTTSVDRALLAGARARVEQR
jgi:hypothetical protein